MKGLRFIAALVALLPLAAAAQRLPAAQPTLQGFFNLPLALGNPVFDNLTDVLGQGDLAFTLPVYKGLGVGVGVAGTWYELNEDGLAPELTIGSVQRYVPYGKLEWTRYTGQHTYLAVGARAGGAYWDWQCGTCRESLRQSGLHWGVEARYFLHASDNLAFGLLLGYQADALRFGPDVVGLDGFPGRTDTGAPYRFLSVGLGFSTGFRPSPESHW
ncbi:MAG: hypothetical protein KJZ58_02420 [Flavobacteriales bacterium]|nr:hypothetical protein [Flavobacteriales bacterium]MCL4281096.1 hypothetical protein [Flavobacteriales bacterium]